MPPPVWSMRLGRISRPDLLVAINVCAGRIPRWTANDDTRMARLAGYVAATPDHSHVMQIRDPPANLHSSLSLSFYLYADADFGSAPDMHSTGYLLALEGPQSFAMILWCSKRHRAVPGSTTQAEFVSLSASLFGEAAPWLEVCESLISRHLPFRQDKRPSMVEVRTQ